MDKVSRVDPITFEILSHRLHQITKEMGTTLERAGGTVNTTQMHDYMASIYRANGEILATGESMGWHVACAGFAVKRILERFEEEGIDPDDVFLINDPYLTAIHQSDVYMVSPIHFEGELVGWSATFVHVMDIGAMSPGGWSPGATEIFHEGIRIPGVKLVEKGKFRKDLFDMILNMTRQPVMVGLDLKCELAANNVAKMRMRAMYAQYGAELVDAVSLEMIRYSESALRRRLKEIPDGVWKDEAEIGKEEKWKLVLTLRKEEDRLVFDFTGTDKQARTGINLPYHATFGACFEVVLQTLGYDIPRNHGVMRPFEVIAPEGTVVNVTPPAPVSLNTTSGGQTAKYLIKSVLTQMLATTEKWQREIIVPYSGQQLAVHGGVNQYQRYYSTDFGLGALRGLGARTYEDGVDAGHAELSCPNVEWKELNFPLLHLFRRYTRDGGGAGRFRGGAGAETALMAYDAPEGHIKVTTHGVVGLNNSGRGLFGGYPGAPSIIVLHEETKVRDLIAQGEWPQDGDEFGGHARHLGYSAFDFKEGEVLYMRQGNSGGCGDPLEREAERVVRDLEDGLLSREAAHDVYGVVVDGDVNLDPARTQAIRAARREERLKSASARESGAGSARPSTAGVYPPSEILSVFTEGTAQRVRCKRCLKVLCDVGEDWKKSCKESLLPPTAAGPLMKDMTGHFLLRQLYCPGCGTTMSAELMGNPDLK